MPNTRLSSSASALAAGGLFLLASAPVMAACPHNSYAFKNAHVITVSGPAVDGATVVVCDGVITAIGTSVAVPADAEVIDASGLTMYPGFVDGYSQYGLPTPAAANAAGARGGRGTAAQAEAADAQSVASTLDSAPVNDPQRYLNPLPNGVQSNRVTAQMLAPENTLEEVRDKGILATLVVPADGIFKGEAAVVSLIGPDASTMLVLPHAGQVMQLTAGRGGGTAGNPTFGEGGGTGYPSSTMGAVAVYRQTLLDTQRLQTEMSMYQQAGGKGLPTPDYDPRTMALLPLVSGQEHAYFVAADQNGIERALNLAKEFNLTPVIIGGNEASKSIPALQAAHASVLLSLSFTAAGAGGGGGGGGGRGGGGGENVAELQSNPAELVKAGIPVGFTTEGLAANQDLVAQVKVAIGKGLSAADAWKALTIWPAQIIGVGNQLGSIEVGKVANLVLASGAPLASDNAAVKWIVVKGVPKPVHPAAAAPAAGGRGRGRGGVRQ